MRAESSGSPVLANGVSKGESKSKEKEAGDTHSWSFQRAKYIKFIYNKGGVCDKLAHLNSSPGT